MESIMQDLFGRALGIQAPWRIQDVQFSEPERELRIYLEYPRGSRFQCPVCGKDHAPVYDSSEREWRHMNFFKYKAFLIDISSLFRAPHTLFTLRSENRTHSMG